MASPKVLFAAPGNGAHRAEAEIRVSEKWLRFSAPNEASAKS
jgi:hypothetical protein